MNEANANASTSDQERINATVNERFGEHRRSILNHHELGDPTPVSFHFNQSGRSINEVCLISLHLNSYAAAARDEVRKAREAHLIRKEKNFLLCRNNYRHDEGR